MGCKEGEGRSPTPGSDSNVSPVELTDGEVPAPAPQVPGEGGELWVPNYPSPGNPFNACDENNGGCSQNAMCSATQGPSGIMDQVHCICNNGYMGNGVQCKRAPVDVTDVNNGTALNASTLSNVNPSDSCRKCMANMKNSSKFANLACKLACKGVEALSDVESNEDDSCSGSDEIEEPVPTPAPAPFNLTKVHKNVTLSGPRNGYFVIAMRSEAFENNNFIE